MNQIIGWTGAYISPYKEVGFSEERRQALIQCIKRRRYNFNYQDVCWLSNCAPIYQDLRICVPSKAQWDSVLDEAYGDDLRGERKLPADVLTVVGKDILFEDEKFKKEACGDE